METKEQTNATQYVLYCRVSTKRQGLGLEAQRQIAHTYATNHNAEIIAEYSEKESAKHSNNANRVELTKAIEVCKKNNCCLLIAKLDRLSRSVEFLFSLQNSGVQFVACDMPQFNTLTLAIFSGLAQYEREMISDRTKRALNVLKQKGVKLGANNGNSHKFNDADRAKAYQGNTDRANNNPNSKKAYYFAIAKRNEGATLQQIADYLNAEQYETASGRGIWKAMQVSRLLQRFA